MHWMNTTTFITQNFINFFLHHNTMSACLNLGIESEDNKHNYTWFREYGVHNFKGTGFIQGKGYIVSHYPKLANVGLRLVSQS